MEEIHMIIYAAYLFIKSLMPAALGSLESILVTVGSIFIMFLGLGLCLSTVTGHDHVGSALDRTHTAALNGFGWLIRNMFTGIGRLLRLIGRSVRALYFWVYRGLTARGLGSILAGAIGVLASLIWIVII